MTPGRYEWTWGSGANQNFTLVIGEVPEPSTWALMLIGFAGLGFVGYRQQQKLAALRASEGRCERLRTVPQAKRRRVRQPFATVKITSL